MKVFYATVAVGALTAGSILAYKYFKHIVPSDIEENVQECLKQLDRPLKKRPTTRFRAKRFRRHTLVVKTCREIKSRFQVIDNPKDVDRIAVERYAYDVMDRMPDVSAVDKMRVAPLAAALYWTKTKTEVEARMWLASKTAWDSNVKYNRRYSRGLFAQAFAWAFGDF